MMKIEEMARIRVAALEKRTGRKFDIVSISREHVSGKTKIMVTEREADEQQPA